MSNSPSSNIDVYLKIIEYKRGIGATQWTVLSIFVTASEAVLVLSLNQGDKLIGALARLFGVIIYWVGYLLYNRYRALNQCVSKYLVELEKENGFAFQQYLDTHFHKKGLLTNQVLIVVGILYFVFAIAVSVVRP